MALAFRQRIFVILVALTAVPTALAVVGWALAVRTVAPAAAARAALAGEAGRGVGGGGGGEVEAGGLGAFREVARRVAHEIKNPLTAMRIAVDQLHRTEEPADRRTAIAVEVMAAETDRLEQLAKEFAEFGRLPEGPKSQVDLMDLLMDLSTSAVPPEIAVCVRPNGEPCRLLGHYDPLRRAFANLLRTAAEPIAAHGPISLPVTPDGAAL